MDYLQKRAKRRIFLGLLIVGICLTLLLGVNLVCAKLNIIELGGGGGAGDNLSFFHANGRDIVSDLTGEKIAFRGVNLDGLEFGSFFNNPYPGVLGTNYFMPRSSDFDNIKAAGFNVVRVPFEWARLVAGWNPGKPLPTSLDAAYLSYLTQIVQMAGSREIYVILDMHDFLKYWSGQSVQVCVDTNSSYQQFLSQTWKLLAEHFHNSPVVLGYDLMNEPVRQENGELCSSCHWKQIAQSIVDAIRTVDTSHLIFVEGSNYSLASDWQIENSGAPFVADSINPKRIAYSPHVFFDFNNDSQYTDAGENVGPIGQWQYYMRDRLMPVIDWSTDNNVPIFIGETNVPCSSNWANVLDAAYRNFFEPLHLSVTLWNYIDPLHCSLANCPLNILACGSNYQLNVAKQYPADPYAAMGNFQPVPSDSLLYDDARINPWESGTGYWGNVNINFCATNPVYSGSCSIQINFAQANFDGVKFYHHYGVDTRHYRFLSFWIYLTGNGQQDFKIFTTSPLPDCSPGSDPEYPPYGGRPALGSYLPSRTTGIWQKVEIPLTTIVDPSNPVINGIAFQNLGSSQDIFYIDQVSLTPA